MSEKKLQIKKKLGKKVEDVDEVYKNYTDENIVKNSKKNMNKDRVLYHSNSQRDFPERRKQSSLIKDSAREELSLRKGFENTNRELNRVLSQRNPLVTVPDDRVQILDMVPRMDIIED